ncbi:MAG: hypothetical protein A3J07_05025 [Candidatus Doudnabacteria bacterium RIFCSPLOWO2_02_FULL_49_13]|uniref:Type 4 fimbrial biogenesis protein PilX N-terminal domain-containing protein n=1 Tax=Candidatus Doudnabacteria bacterium RIFCSPHIGHO2_12_FULL_48_16 TaxID=1817838 RepID=A0A1F5PLD0_9BACT|nr:MAG: hypothetical protein A3B77_04665 [Candidatus Doudnabacteria bacterium RIFCSPHIGHO2_02_FULL_49_24]OGE88181.1 MAG: hypothetical protein A2760_02315 [Candidatus Doudnabacteria bacterium RIFCSPHIGHO2_01_FULL_50_67]OGE90490.1 MAG: hypothetical protein A3E29_05095 [Candidatus Doudnabacteria bacterium RIFCSPHIGHO2_12_FULL_48_16]OGE96552.1 MAG: hypothetical protein A2990_03540 [Candidatus Doudnabacteria bacterium RIFCSPLOWO2_01_FULL_49_40]OGF02676.1 MAG: hypothetical protein A3H14_03375 [Candid
MKRNNQIGQSLIETIIAIFVLTTALTTGLSLAIYAFSSSSLTQNEIVAANLAREGIEVVRMMRDSNWLAGDVKGSSWDLTACSDISGKLCFPKAYQKVPSHNNYDLNSGNQRLVFNSSNNTWDLNNGNNYYLYLQSDGTYSGSANGTSTFARMINLSFNSASPYTNQNSNQELIIKSVVAWQGKNCTAFNSNQDLINLVTPCKITVEEHLTNWKDYK